MLYKIIIKNIDRKNCYIYIISAALYTSVIFILLSLLNINNYVNLGNDSENSKIIFIFYYILLSIIGLIFMFYSLKYYTKTRMKKYALLVILGTTRKKIIKIIFLEFLLLMILALVLGCLVGFILINLVSFIFFLKNINAFLHFEEMLSTLFKTIKISFIFYLLNCFMFLCKFYRKDLSKIMIDGTKREYSYRIMSLLSVIGLGMIITSISLLKDPTFLEIIIYMSICLYGSYLCLKFGMIIILMIYKKIFKSNYLKNLIVLNNFYFKYKSNVTIVYITFLLNFVIIFIVGGIIITTTIKEDYTSIYPYETVLIDYDNNKIGEDLPQNTIEYITYAGRIEKFSEEKDTLLAIRQNDYNQLVKDNLNLKENEVVLIFQQDLNDIILKDSVGLKEHFNFNNNILELFITDIQFKNILGINVPNNFFFMVIPQDLYIGVKETKIYISPYRINNWIKYNNKVEIFSRSREISSIEKNNLIIKISSYFLGIFTVICCLGMLFIKQISDIPQQVKKFKILKYLGMSDKNRKRNVLKEFRLLFCTPILLSNFIVWFFIYAELKRVGVINIIYIKSFLLFQLILAIVQYIFYYFIKRYMLKQIK